jgi:hypothetical protein
MPPALPVEHPAYIVQASSGGLSSAQFLVTTNHTFFATLSVGAPFDPNAVITSSNSSYHVLTSRYSLWNYTFSTVPSSSILPTVPTITILSNAAVLNFQNNYSNTEFDYNVVGPGGSTFYFVVIYPKNLSTVAMSVRVNGTYVPTRLQSNSTHYFVIFLIPSGPYSIALTYANPSVSSGGNLPLFYPGIAVVGAIIALGVAGSVFLVVYVRRYERREELE